MSTSERQKMEQLNINSDRSSSDDLNKNSHGESVLLSYKQGNDSNQVKNSNLKIKEFETINESVEEGKLYLINKLLESERRRIQ